MDQFTMVFASWKKKKLRQLFSRVTKASDLGIIGGFPKDRLITKLVKKSKMVPRQKEERRLDGIVTQTKHFLRNLEVNN